MPKKRKVQNFKPAAKKGGDKHETALGQAPALSWRDWSRWVKFALENHTTQMAVLIEFTGLFALRCGEACALKASDLLLQANPPQMRIRKTKGAGKSPGNIHTHHSQRRRLNIFSNSNMKESASVAQVQTDMAPGPSRTSSRFPAKGLCLPAGRKQGRRKRNQSCCVECSQQVGKGLRPKVSWQRL